ncbi:hypothetical protein ONS95_010499 [Cadophora gregata]|uniref:uncharacterized protein n=1 Tax=Cadophora gregata TaxID=51156 RepID=UPI0026DD1F84|nr:uncharacterized protein ONS95_010499 [Cadophora gregata]KAK0122248.1 hypothetical protein ONS95_010499 [Cadophora gregata]KAK0127724.1 hypothetical protein ONS96_007239 [Cadophora gregata f. sp. sojae]
MTSIYSIQFVSSEIDDADRMTRRSWRGNLIFDAGPNSGGINMTDVRDIVDFLSVCQDHPPLERGETAERARKLQVVEMDCQGGREDDPRAEIIIDQLEWPLDHPLLRLWRPPPPSRDSDPLCPNMPSGWHFDTRLVRVLEELRLPVRAGETDPINAPALGTGPCRPRRIILRKSYEDIDVAHVEVFMDFFRKYGVHIRACLLRGSEAAPIEGHIDPFTLRRRWHRHHYNYLKMRCVVPGCKPYRNCPLKPESHDGWSVVGKRLLKRVFGEQHQDVDSD